MTNQADIDWEGYQLGQQSTQTGSTYNQAGINNSYVPTQDPTSEANKRNQSTFKRNIITIILFVFSLGISLNTQQIITLPINF
jgi:hypothetical protein